VLNPPGGGKDHAPNQVDPFPLISKARTGAAFRVLCLDGGGYLGLATATLLEGMEKHFGVRFADRFDLFAGTSTGAILATGLALGLPASRLVSLYEDLGPKVFQPRRFPSPWWRAAYPLAPLKEALRCAFGTQTLGDIHAKGKGILVTAYNLSMGSVRIFKTDHAPDLSLDSGLLASDVALASAAAPTYFPVFSLMNPVSRVKENFCDGGVVANAPALIAFAEAVSTLQALPGQVRLLSISTPRKTLQEPPRHRAFLDRGRLHWVRSLPDVFIHAGMDNANQLLERVIRAFPDPRPTYKRLSMSNEPSISFDDVSLTAAAWLKSQGAAMAARAEVRESVKAILSD
jgi:uncharacterized protein